MTADTNAPKPVSDIKLAAADLKRIDRLVGPEQRAKFVQDAVKHSLLLGEHMRPPGHSAALNESNIRGSSPLAPARNRASVSPVAALPVAVSNPRPSPVRQGCEKSTPAKEKQGNAVMSEKCKS